MESSYVVALVWKEVLGIEMPDLTVTYLHY